MKALTITARIFQGIIILLILLICLALFMAKSYGQAVMFILIALAIAWWPAYFKQQWNTWVSLGSRLVFIVVVFFLKGILFPSSPATSIYLSEEGRESVLDCYETLLSDWPENTSSRYIETSYGKVHVLECGPDSAPPLMMLHAASMGAHSWAENLEPLADSFHIFAIDNIGEGNRSELKDAQVYPKSRKEIADLYASIADSLNIASSPVFGASNGGFIALNYACYYPERVESLALFGPMGLTQITNGSIFMLAVASLYPFQGIRDAVTDWALGTDPYCHEKYGEWFDRIMKNTIPSVFQPVPVTTEEKQNLTMPVLLFLGSMDRIVGDVEAAKEKAVEFPDIRIEVLESGHLVSAEEREICNRIVAEFLFN